MTDRQWRRRLDKYLEQKDNLHAGRKPRQDKEGFTIADMCDHFLNWKDRVGAPGPGWTAKALRT